MPDQASLHECTLDQDLALRPHEELPKVVKNLVATCGTEACFDHISPVPLPSHDAVVQIIALARRVLFPGYFDGKKIEQVNLEYHLGTELMHLFELVADQITWAVRHDCFRHELLCSHCSDRGNRAALAFVQSLPEIRRLLAMDVQAALEGDPATGSPDEIIFSYPGLLAVTVYRLAHRMRHLKVPLLPRMMSEYAHAKTGIDIHPGAEIGESFFIDHGTGVVIGETAVLGQRVRLYQGVTLGAMSLPRGQLEDLRGVKRHPTIEDEVTIYSGATILGGETVVGTRSVIGGNVWLTESVPPDTKVFLKKPELVYVEPRDR
ncbi:MAG: serine acetyltransferase [Desulfarculaceae bacterium]|nr:serine acetyltransferase [Desulfarculaceae bacterium]MCF8070794.1 serine acetyltransferase [Desulfarculaceae bacterium]MCF8102231.1 serine acetyltransferase [Desulfarculaceae bacterium]MCF8116970.1 serine acetyltransferase [Desulfarculaceae bacterium]